MKKKTKSQLLLKAGRQVFPEIPRGKCGDDFLWTAWFLTDISWLFYEPDNLIGQFKYARSVVGDVPTVYEWHKYARRKGGQVKPRRPLSVEAQS